MLKNSFGLLVAFSCALFCVTLGCGQKAAEIKNEIKKEVKAVGDDLKEIKKEIKEDLKEIAAEIKEKVEFVEGYLTDGKSIVDEAKKEGKTRADFPQSKFDAFKGMDKNPEYDHSWHESAIMGRNSWVAWNAGNQHMFDFFARYSFGWVDLLKVVDTHNRPTRFAKMGLINEPGMVSKTAAKGDVPENPYGIEIDVPSDETARKERFDSKYALYRTEGLDPAVYGYSSGIMGVRLFPNPEFFKDASNAEAWNPKSYREDPIYFENPKLIRPYRVGITCGVCHVAFHPIYPPEDPSEPKWENLSSSIGNQYFREGKFFAHNLDLQKNHEKNFYWQVLDRQPAGTSDTSRVATDHINGPTAINAIFHLKERLRIATKETMGAGAKILPPEVDANGQRDVPHILRDGADSIGVAGATIRVYVNIGLFSEYWLTRHMPGIGLRQQKPFEIAVAHSNSVYWQATEDRLENEAKFLSYEWPMQLKYAKLKDGTTGQEYIDKQPGDLEVGKKVFAEHCARCHSSKAPPVGIDRDSEPGKAWFVEEVKKPEFWVDNFLSEDRRHALTEKEPGTGKMKLATNASRALGTNSGRGHIWDNFSSEDYKKQPSVGELDGGWEAGGKFPWEGPLKFNAPGNGPGHYRTPSLVAIWATAPYLASNSLGKFTGDPSVEGRLEAFHDAAEKLLGLKPRHDAENDGVWRTKGESYLELPGGVFPPEIRKLVKEISKDEDWKEDSSPVRFGPIPDGSTINLLMNLNLTIDNLKVAELLVEIKKALHATEGMEPDQAREQLAKTLMPQLLKNNLCPDFVMDKGHTFANELSEDERRSLIKLLLTL